jgi:histidinol-phosphate aminotransferase
MAALRVGLAFASDSIIDLMNRVKPPYNVSGIAQSEAVVALDRAETIGDWVASTLAHRAELQKKLLEISFVEKIYPSDANFILVKVGNADAVYQFLLNKKIVVRNRSNVELCKGCLRITIGTVEEISRLVDSLREFDRISGVAGVPKIENVTI